MPQFDEALTILRDRATDPFAKQPRFEHLHRLVHVSVETACIVDALPPALRD